MYRDAPFTFDFEASLIHVDESVTDVYVPALYQVCKLAQASQEGMLYDPIAKGSGLVALGGGVQVGLTVEILGDWQVKFTEGNRIVRFFGGNLVGGPGGDPIAYSAGVQVLLIQSAASTVVNVSGGGSSGLTLAQIEASTVLAKEATVAAKASQASVTALGTPLQASEYTAPNNTNIAAAVWSAPTRTLTVTDAPVGTRNVRLQQLLRNKG
jgi:hypothetical protein